MKAFCGQGQANSEYGLIPPFRCGDTSWYLPKKNVIYIGGPGQSVSRIIEQENPFLFIIYINENKLKNKNKKTPF